VVYVGSKTGRDGIHGATMASAEFDDSIEEKRPTVQVGDPFTEKLLIEACLELMASDAVIAIQDMGAAGLTCSSVEMGAKGDLGIELDLDRRAMPRRRHDAYEMMLSESQERMLMVLRPEQEKEAEAIFHKWGLDFAIVGKTTDDLRFRCMWNGEEVANLPVWEQYDNLIQSNTAQIPGGDAAVVRINEDGKAVATCVDVTPRYVEADPFEGGKQAVAEVWRNLTAVGADPVAVTDNLNFGNPEKPEIMGTLVHAIKGIGEACRALGFPVVSGNVSLYNETHGQGILPTPAIGGVGIIPDVNRMATIAFKNEGDAIILIGGHGTHLGQSMYLREVLGREEGTPPPVDLDKERKHGDFVRTKIRKGRLTAVHDISDGGLVAALAEMSLASKIGCKIELPRDVEAHEALFAEDQARYVVTCRPMDAHPLLSAAEDAGVPATRIGTVTGSGLIVMGEASISINKLREAHEGWFPGFMSSASEMA
jgi:phosphoribosylformylglycinamidine (FGAM) synthase-like enzyme